MTEQGRTVAHYTWIWLPQTQTWLHTQAARLPARFMSHVICDTTANLEQFPWPRLHCPSRTRRMLDKFLVRTGVSSCPGFLCKSLCGIGADILHSHFGMTGWQNRMVGDVCGARHVVSFYGVDLSMLPRQHPEWRGRYRGLFARADAFLCEGHHMADTLRKLECPPEKIRVHHLGIDLERIPFRPRVFTPGEPLRVLIAASFREKKGIPYALAALGALRYDMPLGVTIIGDASSAPEHQEEKRRILAAINKHNLRDCVRLLGYQPYSRMIEEAYAHHIFLSPSVTAADGDTEGGAPVSIIEMAASGMPVVSSRHCDIPEVIPEGRCGWLADERDVNGLVKHLRDLAAHPENWAEVVQAARAHIETEYDANRQGERLGEIYESILRD